MDQDRVFPGISADSVGLRLFRPKQPIEALGLAVDHLMTSILHPSFLPGTAHPSSLKLQLHLCLTFRRPSRCR